MITMATGPAYRVGRGNRKAGINWNSYSESLPWASALTNITSSIIRTHYSFTGAHFTNVHMRNSAIVTRAKMF